MTDPQTQSTTEQTAPAEKARRQNTKVGVVISDKMEKTRTIAVQRSIRHPFYKKIIRRTSTFHAHDALPGVFDDGAQRLRQLSDGDSHGVAPRLVCED